MRNLESVPTIKLAEWIQLVQQILKLYPVLKLKPQECINWSGETFVCSVLRLKNESQVNLQNLTGWVQFIHQIF